MQHTLSAIVSRPVVACGAQAQLSAAFPDIEGMLRAQPRRSTAPAAPAGLVACIGAAWTARGCANECRSSQPRCKTAAGPPAGARAEALPKRTRLFPAARGCQSLLVDTRTHTVAHNQHCTKQAHHLCLCAAADTATLCRVCWGCAVGSLQALCSQMQSTIADKVSRALDDV